jgi:hypothetical protein
VHLSYYDVPQGTTACHIPNYITAALCEMIVMCANRVKTGLVNGNRQCAYDGLESAFVWVGALYLLGAPASICLPVATTKC